MRRAEIPFLSESAANAKESLSSREVCSESDLKGGRKRDRERKSGAREKHFLFFFFPTFFETLSGKTACCRAAAEAELYFPYCLLELSLQTMARSMAAARSSAGSSAKKANSNSRRSGASAASRVPAAPAAAQQQQQQPSRRPVAARAAGDDSGSAKVRCHE